MRRVPSSLTRILFPTISAGNVRSSRIASCTAVRVRLQRKIGEFLVKIDSLLRLASINKIQVHVFPVHGVIIKGEKNKLNRIRCTSSIQCCCLASNDLHKIPGTNKS